MPKNLNVAVYTGQNNEEIGDLVRGTNAQLFNTFDDKSVAIELTDGFYVSRFDLQEGDVVVRQNDYKVKVHKKGTTEAKRFTKLFFGIGQPLASDLLDTTEDWYKLIGQCVFEATELGMKLDSNQIALVYRILNNIHQEKMNKDES